MKVCSVCQRCYEDETLYCPEDASESLVAGRPGSREIVSDYRLDSLVETNAVGEIYRATNTEFNQPCLFRIYSSKAVTKSGQRFLSEIQKAASLKHPNLVRLFGIGVLEDGDHYLATEAIAGQTLRHCLQTVGSIANLTAVTIVRQTAEGLQAAHSAGLIHGNINPDNILLASDAENQLLVKIQNFDFGAIKHQVLSRPAPDTEYLLSEMKYWSPEQCAGETGEISTDIYSLGVVLYEAIAGQPPFDAADSVKLTQQQLHQMPPAPEIANLDIRALLTHTMMQALQKDASSRIKTALAFSRQLRHIEQLLIHAPQPIPSIETTAPKSINFPTGTAQKMPVPVKSEPPVVLPREPELIFRSAEPSIASPLKLSIEPVQQMPAPAKIEPPIPPREEPAPAPEVQAVSKVKLAPLAQLTPDTVISETPENSLAFDLQAEPAAEDNGKTTAAAQAARPVLLDWDQPDDVPTEFEVLEAIEATGKEIPEILTAPEEPAFENSTFKASAVEELSFEDENLIFAVEQKKTAARPGKKRKKATTREYPIFAHLAEIQAGQSPLMARRTVRIGLGLAALVLVFVTVILVNQKFQAEVSSEASGLKDKDGSALKTEKSVAAIKKGDSAIDAVENQELKSKTGAAISSEATSSQEVPESRKSESTQSEGKATKKALKADSKPDTESDEDDGKAKPKEQAQKQPTRNMAMESREAPAAKSGQVEKKTASAGNSNSLVRPRIVQNVVIRIGN